MEYNFQKHVDFLLENACTSIRYLVHKDMLKTPTDEPFMKEMYEEILQQANVQKHLSGTNILTDGSATEFMVVKIWIVISVRF